MDMTDFITITAINEQKQQVQVAINSKQVVAIAPYKHPEYGDVVMFETVKGTYMAISVPKQETTT